MKRLTGEEIERVVARVREFPPRFAHFWGVGPLAITGPERPAGGFRFDRGGGW
jgi:hypothetical protein